MITCNYSGPLCKNNGSSCLHVRNIVFCTVVLIVVIILKTLFSIIAQKNKYGKSKVFVLKRKFCAYSIW